MDEIIQEKLKQLGALTEQIRQDIQKVYPPGARVSVMLSSKQKTPSHATVVGSEVQVSTWGADAWAYVRVELDGARPYSRQARRSIPIDMVAPL